MKALLLVTLLSLAFFSAQAANWAVLVAGSNGFWNYRHQADICHAYQVVSQNGIPAENIITLAYDDIASDPSNPFPGQIFNKPNGTDVYAGCNIDYNGTDVDIETFTAVLTGNSSAVGGRKVLNSTEDDYVFINFVDHGAAGLIAFPNDFLYADTLIALLQQMHDNKMYKRLVFYLEACESGSMFQGLLPNDTFIFATTAANAGESSWGTYCPPDDMVNDTEIGSCLGDLYSVNWLENSDAAFVKIESLITQFTEVQTETTLSHVSQFGDATFDSDPIGDFQGDYSVGYLSSLLRKYDFYSPSKLVSVNARDIKLAYLQRQAHKLGTEAARQALTNELDSRSFQDEFFSNLASSTLGTQNGISSVEAISQAMGSFEQINFPCLKEAVSTYEDSCNSLGEYGLKYVRVFVNLCNTPFGEELPNYISQACGNTKTTFVLH